MYHQAFGKKGTGKESIAIEAEESDAGYTSNSEESSPLVIEYAVRQEPEDSTISGDFSAGSNLEVRLLAALKDQKPPNKPLIPLSGQYQPSTLSKTLKFGNVEANRGESSISKRRRPKSHHEPYILRSADPESALDQEQAKIIQKVARQHKGIKSDLSSSEMDDSTTREISDVMPDTCIPGANAGKIRAAEADNSYHHVWMKDIGDIKGNLLPDEDRHQAGIESLQEEIAKLQKGLRQLEDQKQKKSPKPYHILYRIGQSLYFDHPEWTQGRKSIVSRVPVKNLDLFLERNKNISFLIYRDFTVLRKPAREEKLQRPRHSTESIEPINKGLYRAMQTLLQNNWRYDTFLQKFHETGEVNAPYLFIFHNRSHWSDFLAEFSMNTRKHLAVITQYVAQNYGNEYAAADALFAQQKLTADYFKYLFQPGDVLVVREGSRYRGIVAKSWPYDDSMDGGEPSDNDDDWGYREQDSTLHKSSSRAKSALRPLRHSDEAVMFGQVKERPVHSGKDRNDAPVLNSDSTDNFHTEFIIEAWEWTFDGQFKRRANDTILRLPQKSTDISIESPEWNTHELDVYPLRFAPQSVVDQLRHRGQMFWKCRKRCLISYRKPVTGDDNDTDERFMVDVQTFRKVHSENTSYSNVTPIETMSQDEMDREEPSDEAFLYLVPLQIKGFNLRTKKWLDLDTDYIQPVTWNMKAFDSLVLNRKTKDLIKALVSKQISSTKSTDVIAGKGNGLILLLHGGPGTGKTLTAEGVAEIAKKPLYRVTCGDVGTEAKNVEQYLESVLHLGKIWDCVVLLDEAEVFLERRSLDDLQRNALVSVFLRVIEYYEGILILTSNRVGTFDEAFRSRIQIAVHYPPLGAFQRLQIWNNFIDRLESFNDGAVDVNDLRDHLEELQKAEINGRQIRNAITTARQYAEWQEQVMNYEHLTTALEVAAKFDAYSEKLRGGMTEDEIAEDEGLR